MHAVAAAAQAFESKEGAGAEAQDAGAGAGATDGPRESHHSAEKQGLLLFAVQESGGVGGTVDGDGDALGELHEIG